MIKIRTSKKLNSIWDEICKWTEGVEDDEMVDIFKRHKIMNSSEFSEVFEEPKKILKFLSRLEKSEADIFELQCTKHENHPHYVCGTILQVKKTLNEACKEFERNVKLQAFK